MLLAFAVTLSVIAVVTGIKPNKSRPVAHTRMMGVARFVLVVIAFILTYLAFRTRAV
jgi:multisubunit Na+/H+ antiporter MnhB subunit